MARDTHEQAEQFFDSQPLQFPDPPEEPPEHALEIDAGYIRGIPEKCAGRRTFAIITARLKKSNTPAAYDAFVNEVTLDPLVRFHHFLHRAGVGVDEPLAIIGDGGEDVAYPTYMPWRPVTRILDWFHIAMRFEHLLQRARGLQKEAPERSDRLINLLESAKWRLWHGQSGRSMDRPREVQEDTENIFRQRVSEMIRYLELNRGLLPQPIREPTRNIDEPGRSAAFA